MRRLLVVIAPLLAAVVAPACDGCAQTAPDGEPSCVLPDGTELGVGETGPAGDGCNTCVCTLDKELRCGTVACNDAGPE